MDASASGSRSVPLQASGRRWQCTQAYTAGVHRTGPIAPFQVGVSDMGFHHITPDHTQHWLKRGMMLQITQSSRVTLVVGGSRMCHWARFLVWQHSCFFSLQGVQLIQGTPQVVTTDVSGLFKIWDIRMNRCVQDINLPHRYQNLCFCNVQCQARFVRHPSSSSHVSGLPASSRSFSS